jgi:hypothetical protein
MQHVTVEWAVALAAGFAVLAWIVGAPLVAARRRRALAGRPLDEAQRRAIEAYLPSPRPLPRRLRARLERLVSVFIGEKEFVGRGGLDLTAGRRLVPSGAARQRPARRTASNATPLEVRICKIRQSPEGQDPSSSALLDAGHDPGLLGRTQHV